MLLLLLFFVSLLFIIVETYQIYVGELKTRVVADSLFFLFRYTISYVVAICFSFIDLVSNRIAN